MKFRIFSLFLMVVSAVGAEDSYFVKCDKSESKNLCERSNQIVLKKVKSGRETFYCIFYDATENDSEERLDDVEITLSSSDWTVQAKGLDNPSFSSTQFKYQVGYPQFARLIIKQKNNLNLPAIKGLTLNGQEACDENAPATPIRNKVTEPEINYKLICGERPETDTNKLIIGSVTSIQAWPWHATLYSYNASSGHQSYRCGGVLVNDRTVLTAATCVVNSNIMYTVNLGQSKAFSTSNQKSYQVAQVLLHSQFYAANLTCNIALLKLHEPVLLSNSIQPVCLPDKNDLDIDGKEGKVVGFGYDENGIFNQNLKEADMKAEKYFRCLQRYRDFYRSFSITNSFCARSSSPGGGGICAGDTGNGFFVRNQDNQYYLYGIASIAPIEFSQGSYCRVKDAGVFIQITKFVDWITENWF